jgi:hypothetical protein
MTLDELRADRFRRWDAEPPPPPLTKEQQDIIAAAFRGALPKRKGSR